MSTSIQVVSGRRDVSARALRLNACPSSMTLCILLAVALLFSVVGCGGKREAATAGEDAAAPSRMNSDELAAIEDSARDLSANEPDNGADSSVRAFAPEESSGGSPQSRDSQSGPPEKRTVPILDGPIVPGLNTSGTGERDSNLTNSGSQPSPPVDSKIASPLQNPPQTPSHSSEESGDSIVASETPERTVAESHADLVPSLESPATDEPIAPNIESPKKLMGAKAMDIYFATDRRPTAEVLPSMLRTFAPTIAVACVCWAMLIGVSFARKFQAFWIVGTGLATCAGIMVLHVCIVRWQEYSRIANGNNTKFSVLRYEPTADDYPLHVGIAQVSIPDTHQKGKMEAPSLLRLEFSESPQRHIMLQSVEVQENVWDWFEDLSESVRYEVDHEGFLFIHGYNVKFGDALKRTAQLAHDLNVEGPVISYSWPSRGQLVAYGADEATVQWAAPHLEKLLIDITTKTKIRRVNILAHSMGNRALMDSIERIYLRQGGAPDSSIGPKRIGALVLAAPDVDEQLFSSRYREALEQVADRSCLYFTDEDLALRASSTLHSTRRLGLDGLSKDSQMEAIHTGSQGIFSLGHSYYGSDPAVIDDIRRVLNRTPAAKTSWLSAGRTRSGAKFWRLDRDRYLASRPSSNR